MAATLRVVDLSGDWPYDDAEPRAGTAAEAAAAAVEAEPETAPTVHPCTRARVHAKSSLLLLPPVWSVLVGEVTDFMRAGEGNSAPWEVQPPSLAGLHDQVMRRSETFAGLPAARGAYIGVGYLCALACAGCYWAGWVLFGSPGRLVLSVLLFIVLRVTGVLPPIFGI